MAEMQICCPHCQQVITCDEAWGGQEMACPTCQGPFLVPAPAPRPAKATHNPLVPKPPAAGNSQLSLGGHSQQPATSGKSIPIRNLTGPPPKKSNPLVKVAIGIVVVAALGVGGYFGFQFVSEHQAKLNAKRQAAEKNADGGEVGHTMELYNVLNATDPNRHDGPLGGAEAKSRRRSRAAGEEGAAPGDSTASAAADKTAPVVPATYTLDIGTAKIPEGRVNGMITGTNFVAEIVRIDQVPTAQLLRFLQGPIVSPDRGVMLYLHLKAGETLGGQKLTVSPDMPRGPSVPTVTKLWKPNPKFAARQQNYFTGYALKLELGQPTNGVVPGKIFLALPDQEQTVVAGAFDAATAVTEAGVQPAATPMNPAGTGPSTPERAAFERRYGIRR